MRKLKYVILGIVMLLLSASNPTIGTVELETVDLQTTIGFIRRPPRKMVALTFDDGPSAKTTSQLLDILQEYGVHATFFVLGTNVEAYPDLTMRIASEGHTIGSHSYNHKLITKRNDEELTNMMNNTLDLIEMVIGERPKFVRPPYGQYTNYFASNVDASIILWDVDTLDWRLKSPEAIADEALDNIRNGSIVLIHDIYKDSVKSVPIIIEKLREEGYSLVSLDEMFAEYGAEILKHEIYFSGREINSK